MPGVEENREIWDGTYDWPESGDEWSASWGGADSQWHASVRPRVEPFLPAGTVLEIAPGFGRWSSYLIPQATKYVGVDLSSTCVATCRQRFGTVAHAEFHVNDGRSLDMIASRSVDLAFSFDSLVHVEDDVIAAYLHALGDKLSDNGVIFFHHSNLGACRPVGALTRLAIRVQQQVRRRPAVGLDLWRGRSMTAGRFRELALEAGLSCIGQEVINWLGSRYLDCISVATRPGSKWDRPNVIRHNPHFMAEAASASASADVYRRRGALAPDPASDARRTHYFGPSSTMITTVPVGPWAVSILGPWPKWREMRRSRGA